MPRLDDSAIKVMKVLDEHRALDALQIAALGELSVSEAVAGLHQLADNGLLIAREPIGEEPLSAGPVYSLDADALAEWLQPRGSSRETQPA